MRPNSDGSIMCGNATLHFHRVASECQLRAAGQRVPRMTLQHVIQIWVPVKWASWHIHYSQDSY